ncbi:TPA: type IVB secretion system protein IcmC/DotE [Legionella pneumophila]|uniref:type IVB secretion system protein IcmC/DotE n=1 Tax=Legionella pneumophila TaxID=446 RepID=UPI0007882B51|nr:type IVB secretion system protein IcmC/DotE [Legionella pneumophila]MDW8879564.1 type IVB secretion system protein IcmC/DotE [Legionella pneumophila subsp. fraseri]MDW8962667.1 type IVB secretion system protein IcmC/DotE [Legionella pneumophila subsp. fraseri]MDW9036662.1 type IVB secretion system protein IcmC/DotE [Legionella pneumophila subsp. fraseri]MDW9039866.1 type IVB secretion system protein IcmC/DotE [Legionella pneumophila subsp. fraseri]MDW9042856.1 type IVB secretion system prot
MADPTCTGGTVSCWIVSQANILANVANQLEPVQRLITGGAYLIGCAFIFKAIYSLKVYGEARTMMSSNTSIKEPVMYLLVGALLIYFPSLVSSVLQTTFGYSSPLSYSGGVSSGSDTITALFGSGSLVGRPLVMIIRVIGLIAFVRGWVLIARSASQGQPPGGTGKGLIHVFGGILAINIVGTIDMINNTLYGT